jgi:endonuclease G
MHVYTKDGKPNVFKIERIDSALFKDTHNLTPQESPNLLQNSDFESWTDDQLDYWKSASTASNAKLFKSEDAYSGNYAVLIEGANSNKRMAYKELELEADTYTFTIYAKATTENPAQVKLGYVPITEGKVGSYRYATNYTTLNNAEWTLVTYQFTLSEKSVINLLVMNPSASGQNILVDDACLKTTPRNDNLARMEVHAYGDSAAFNLTDIDSIVFVYQEPFIENEPTKRLEFPMPKGDDSNIVIVHTATLNDRTGEQGINYSVEWDTRRHAQRWSCYQLYASLLEKNASRYSGRGTGLDPGSQYPNDPDMPIAYQFTKDPYPGTGFDHGHICPSDDRVSAAEANYQTFFITNMMPQTHSLNAGMWSRMESQVKSWGGLFDTLYVCKGGTIDNENYIIDYIGSEENCIPIPRYFFMALLGKSASGYSAIGLWVDHNGQYTTKDPIGNLAVNIRTLEELTGINFFHNLPDDVEKAVEEEDIETLINKWGLTTN